MDVKTAYKYAWKTSKEHFRDEKSGIDVFLFREQDTDIVVIQGSIDVKDWLTNFTFWRKPVYARKGSRVRAHAGYLSGWERLRDGVLGKVTAKNILVTGFSMGGGLSNLVALDVQYNNPASSVVCVDFAGPRIWNKAGQESYNKRVLNTYRFVNGNDVVSKVPPWYRYGGKEENIGDERKAWKFSIAEHLEFYARFGEWLKSKS